MTTTIRSNHSNRTLHIINTDGSVTVRFDADRVTADRAEFIAALETELDGTWIDRADLPKVTADGDALRAGEQYWLDTAQPDVLRREALELLALARHLEANPPVDEAAVDALAKVLIEHGEAPIPGTLKLEALARRLVKAGVRAPEAGDQP